MFIHQFVRTYVEDIWTHSTHLSCVCSQYRERAETRETLPVDTRGTQEARDVDPYPAGLSHVTVISDF